MKTIIDDQKNYWQSIKTNAQHKLLEETEELMGKVEISEIETFLEEKQIKHKYDKLLIT